MAHAKFSTNGTTWTTATFTTTVSGNFVNFENVNYHWGALTDTGQIWKSVQETDNLGSFNISTSPSTLTQLSSFNNNFIGVSTTLFQTLFHESIDLSFWNNNNLNWTTVTSNFGFTTILSLDYGNGLWIAGGYTGQMRTSTNGSTWTTVNSNFGTTIISSIAYGNGLWVAGGYRGQIRTSTNGSAWTTVNSNFGNTIIDSIAYGNGLWIAGGRTGQMRTSTNGSTWTTVNSNFGTTAIRFIAYSNGLWIAGGSTGQIRTSTNGSTWTTVTSNFGNAFINSIAYGNGLWIAVGDVGQIRTSTNGSAWTTVNSNFGNTIIFSIAYGNGVWVVGGGDFSPSLSQMRNSTNGSDWTTVNSNFGNTIIRSIAYGNGLWFASGYRGQMRTSTNPNEQLNLNKFIKSEDEQKAAFLNNDGILFNWNGTDYEKISTGINDNFVNGAIRNNGGTYEYIIQGNNALYRSTDLTTWTTISVPPASDVNDIIAK
jgi:hypothetical protein